MNRVSGIHRATRAPFCGWDRRLPREPVKISAGLTYTVVAFPQPFPDPMKQTSFVVGHRVAKGIRGKRTRFVPSELRDERINAFDRQ
jgi:hypothetical protein